MKLVALEELANVWPRVCHWIEAALPYGQGDENLWDIFIRLARCDYQLWYEPGRFAAVVQVCRYPRQSVATVLYVGGSGLQEMKRAMEEGREWCRKNGVAVIRACGREGWERVMGMKRIGVIMQERL